MKDFDYSTNGASVTFAIAVCWLFAIADVMFSLFYFNARALIGYVTAVGLIGLFVLIRVKSFSAPDESWLGYVIILLVVVLPLGNVLNLGWLLDRRYRNA
ncbi:MAG: hypothetical protein ABIT47_03560 [Candidatus Paceibacterota bacterium]